MMGVLNLVAKALRRFRKDTDGNATIEFVLVLPAFMLLFTSAYEAGMLSTRHVMLERGLDVAVREVRIGKIKAAPDKMHQVISQRICDVASIIPECMKNLRLEMINRDPRAWTNISDNITCVDRSLPNQPTVNLNGGGNNELMVLRVCSLFDPMIPTTGLGKEIPKESGNAYALVATSSYVMEPFQ